MKSDKKFSWTNGAFMNSSISLEAYIEGVYLFSTVKKLNSFMALQTIYAQQSIENLLYNWL
jgi:hypothetical protein